LTRIFDHDCVICIAIYQCIQGQSIFFDFIILDYYSIILSSSYIYKFLIFLFSSFYNMQSLMLHRCLSVYLSLYLKHCLNLFLCSCKVLGYCFELYNTFVFFLMIKRFRVGITCYFSQTVWIVGSWYEFIIIGQSIVGFFFLFSLIKSLYQVMGLRILSIGIFESIYKIRNIVGFW
jgi:hypothetical protein